MRRADILGRGQRRPTVLEPPFVQLCPPGSKLAKQTCREHRKQHECQSVIPHIRRTCKTFASSLRFFSNRGMMRVLP